MALDGRGSQLSISLSTPGRAATLQTCPGPDRCCPRRPGGTNDARPAGYFVLAYHWDHHATSCTSGQGALREILAELAAPELPTGPRKALLEAGLGAGGGARPTAEDPTWRAWRGASRSSTSWATAGTGPTGTGGGPAHTLQLEHRGPSSRRSGALRRLVAAQQAGRPAGRAPRAAGRPRVAAAEARKEGRAKAESGSGAQAPARVGDGPGQTAFAATSMRCPRRPGTSTPSSSRSSSCRGTGS
jgi:hypothetical protein